MLDKLTKLGFSSTECKELIKVSNDIEKDYELLKKGYPIQYLIGYINFYGYKIYVNKNVLIPRFETELLVEKLLKYAKELFKNPKVLDLCTGSGAIAIAVKKNINCTIDASDISKKALEIAKKNIEENKVEINLLEDDLLKNNNKKYDIIISNPPYISKNEQIMKTVYDHEPHLALFADNNGLEFYERIIKESKNNLNKKFIIAFEIGYEQSDYITSLARNQYPKAKIITEKDYSGKDRYIFIINE